MTTPSQDPVREALQLAREYVQNASERYYDGTNGHGIRTEAKRRLALIDAALTIPARPQAGEAVGLTLNALQAAHAERQEEWCPDQKPDLSFRGNELGGECGEAQNVIKKLERERRGWRGSRDTVEHLGEELADVVHCATLCAITAGIDLEAAVIAKFNSTSEKNSLATKIAHPTEAAPAIPEGETLADRLDWLADRQPPGSQAQSDLYAAATIWRKHLKPSLLTQAAPAAVQGEREYQISAGYFPAKGEVDLTWQRASDSAMCAVTLKVTPEQGEKICEVVWPCQHYSAEAVQGEALTDLQISRLRDKHGITSSGRGIKEWENVRAFARDILSVSAPTADPVRIAGRAMANICFNLSQHEGQVLTAQWCASMKEAQKRWDEALSTTKD
ncbi:MAG: hypothetical protein J0H69_17145 [Burkholderiales bacterium]|nr:hypothetical protein [Burkholderiales bacterium]